MCSNRSKQQDEETAYETRGKMHIVCFTVAVKYQNQGTFRKMEFILVYSSRGERAHHGMAGHGGTRFSLSVLLHSAQESGAG